MSAAAGLMVNRVRFEGRVNINDGYGNSEGQWHPIFTAWAGFKATPGREALEAGRLESTMTGILTLRRSAQSLTLIAADRGVFIVGPYTGRTFNIRSIVPSHDNSTLELAIEEGVAT
jgi:head-tail adaptor